MKKPLTYRVSGGNITEVSNNLPAALRSLVTIPTHEVNLRDSLSKQSYNKLVKFLKGGYVIGGYSSVPTHLAKQAFDDYGVPYMEFGTSYWMTHGVNFYGFATYQPKFDQFVTELDEFAKMIELTAPVEGHKPYIGVQHRHHSHTGVGIPNAVAYLPTIEAMFRKHVWDQIGIDPAKVFEEY